MLHLLAHLIKSTNAVAAGRRLKEVVCEKCQTKYWYSLSRNAAGRASGFILSGHAGMARGAEANAQNNLDKRLDKEAELVPCPECHWINDDLVARVRRRRYRQATPLAIFLLCMAGVAFMLVYSLSDKRSEPTTLAADVAAGFVIAAIAVFFIRAALRRRINPNLRFPLPPELSPGTPPAMVNAAESSGGPRRLVAADIAYAAHSKFDGWAILRADQLVFPKTCCLCLKETGEVYRPRLAVSKENRGIPVPFCDDCKRVFRRVWWFAALLTIVGAVALGAIVAVAVPYIDEEARWLTASIISTVAALAGLFSIPNKICRPYRFGTIDKERGIMKFASKNADFTELLKEQVRRSDAVAASQAIM